VSCLSIGFFVLRLVSNAKLLLFRTASSFGASTSY
jgi:hypothetical protein